MRHAVLWLGVYAMAAALASAQAAAQCSRVVDVERELPREIDTPAGNQLSYSYDLESERYYVVATRGGSPGIAQGPYVLTRGCAPAKLHWESDRFVLLTAACGTFCWSAVALPVESGLRARGVLRPLAFDAARNLLASYPDPGGVVEIVNLVTGLAQRIETPARCFSTHETCFDDLAFTAEGVSYVWKYWRPLADGEFEYFPPETVTAPLDAALLRE